MSELHLTGLKMHRDEAGTIHIDGGDRGLFIENIWTDARPDDPPAFCIHDADGRCPGDSDVPSVSYGSFARVGGVRIDAVR